MENGDVNGNQPVKITDFDIKLNREFVFHLIDCYPESPIYDEVIEEYDNLVKEVYPLFEPVAVLRFGLLNPSLGLTGYGSDAKACYVLFTIGKKVSELSSRYFANGDYLAGMLADAMADDYLYQLDHAVSEIIAEYCLSKQCGIGKRLEIPADIGMEAQKTILSESGADKELGLGITEGYMFTTVKTGCFILILEENGGLSEIQHNCGKCNVKDCRMRKNRDIRISVVRDGSLVGTFSCGNKESLLEALIRQGFPVNADCGGRGACGKCKFKILKGKLDITSQDRKLIRKEELENGFRLACRAYPKEDCTICIYPKNESDFQIITENSIDIPSENKNKDSLKDNSTKETLKKNGRAVTNSDDKICQTKGREEDGYGIAVDIGTTTIAVSLVGLSSKSTYKTYTAVNRQRTYGADVISRIKASNEGKKDVLQNLIRKELLESFRSVISDAGIDKNRVKKIAVAGNTTMEHLLMGYSCETLGVYPFTPVNIRLTEKKFKEVFVSDDLDVMVTLLPGISAYVGADIVAGLSACGFDRKEAPCILIDLGTNGELAIGCKDRILVSSTAAGPAFEGGNISCGTGSIAGAICGAVIKDGKLTFDTIGKIPPVGICGTGVVEITSELRKAGIIDETGLLADRYFNGGYPVAVDFEQKSAENGEQPILFTQKDIREVQLAKAAVRAGIETLILRYGISCGQIETVYLAGGFGYKINIEKAMNIGLLPKEFSGRIKAVGNSSLFGAVQYLTDDAVKQRMEDIISVSKEINLSNDQDFFELYVNNMNFE